MKISELARIIKEEITTLIPLSDTQLWEIEENVILGELLDANGETFKYTKTGKGIFTYVDSLDNLFFARINYSAVAKPFFEFKTGWFLDNDISKPRYEPSLPQNVTSKDLNIRTNTVAKIYHDEVIPYFKTQTLSDILTVRPISQARYQFAIRLVKKYTPKEWQIIEDAPKLITIIKSNKNEYTDK